MMEENVADAADKGDWEKARELVGRGRGVNAVGGRWRGTGLHYAASSGNKAFCELLLEKGANISPRDKDGDQPLHLAFGNHADICKLLVDHGADVTAVNNYGKTPLLIAAALWRDSPAVCGPLITNESVNVADHDGNHALHIAAHILTVQLLVDCGADVNALNKHGQTPLHTAAGGEEDCPELCEILLKHGAEIDAVDEDGNQPLHLASIHGHSETVALLVSCQADTNAANEHGQTPLHTAAASGRSEWLTLLTKSMSGEVSEVKAKPSDTIATVKDQLQTKEGSSPWDRLLIHKGKQLRDEQTLADAGITDGTELKLVLCPRGLTGMGSEVGELFVRALSEGAVEIIRAKILIVGKDRVGKTSFKRSMLKQKFQKVQPSTPVAKAELVVVQASNWRQVADKVSELLDQQIARAAFNPSQRKDQNSQTTRAAFDMSQEKDQNSQATTLSEDTSNADSQQSDSRHADGEVGPGGSVRESQTSAARGNASDINTEQLKAATAMSEDTASSIEKFQNDPKLMKQDASRIHVTIFDLGGHEPMLPGQTLIVTPGSFYLVVFNAAERLSDKAISFFLPPDSPPLPVHNFWIETNYDAIALWATIVSLAHVEHELVTDPPVTPLSIHQLGKCKGAASPPMFLIGTHAKDVTEQMKKEQNAYLSKTFKGKTFQQHIIRPSDQPDDWFFCVENSVSDPDSPDEDPSVRELKKLIEEMATTVCEKLLIPATWSVLEKVLDALEEQIGSALSKFHVIQVYASRLCHISEERELRAALSYLDEAGSIIYPQRSAKLRNTIVTKPNWLFMVFNVISSTNRPSPQFSQDWDRVRKDGVMSWHLTDHRLKAAGVKKEEYNDVLTLLNCFFILCTNPFATPLSQSSLPHEIDYFVPCLLEVEFKGPFAAAVPPSPDAPQPMSLIICPKNVDFIREQLHFRLMTCCIEKYPECPVLKRNYALYHVNEDVDLELIYDSKKYIIVSLIDIDKELCRNELKRLCKDVRLFLHEKLDEVKNPGLSGFQFSWCIQHPGLAVPVSVEKLVCVDEYQPSCWKKLMRCERRVRLNSHEKAALDYWFDNCGDDGDQEVGSVPSTAALPRKDLSLVERAVMECAAHRWLSIGLELGYNTGQLQSMVHSIPVNVDKLRFIIHEKAMCAESEDVAQQLLQACRDIPDPVIGAVQDKLDQYVEV